MTTWEFTAALSGVIEISDESADALYEAGCDDATVGSSSGGAKVSFAREAPSLQEVIRSAIADVQKADGVVDRVQIEHEELVAWSIA